MDRDREAPAVVVPFGVPNDGRGLGLGLAAIVQGFARVKGESVGLAQIVGRRNDDPESPPGPVEAFILPQQWRDLAGQGNAPEVRIVLTGAFEPPSDAPGELKLVAFDARDGGARCIVETHVDAERAGAAIVDAVTKAWAGVGGEVGEMSVLRDLGWSALESVIRAERCAMHDPTRGGPHDRLAAMLHFGRAIEDAPDARYPAGRLAAIALDAALGPQRDPKLADAAVRAVTRAIADAPGQPDLLEATAALHVRLGHTIEGEATALAGLARDPARPRLYVLLSEARRTRGDLAGARRAIEDGVARATDDPMLRVELGTVLAAMGDIVGAQRAWREALAREPLHVAAFAQLAAHALSRGDAIGAQALVDMALAGPNAHPEVLRCALRLAHAAEPVGVARAARIVTLARALLALTPNDAGAEMALAQALAQTGETKDAIGAFARVETLAKGTPLAMEAQRARFALAEPLAALEIDAALRASTQTGGHALDAIAVRARRLAAEHPVWPAWLALGVVERRRGLMGAAREALVAALAACEACSLAHRELARVLAAMGDARAAMTHAEACRALEGDSPGALGAMAVALAAAGQREEADAAMTRALAGAPNDPELLAARDAMHEREPPPSAWARLRARFDRTKR